MSAEDDDEEVMTDADFERALDALKEKEENGEVGELLSEFFVVCFSFSYFPRCCFSKRLRGQKPGDTSKPAAEIDPTDLRARTYSDGARRGVAAALRDRLRGNRLLLAPAHRRRRRHHHWASYPVSVAHASPETPAFSFLTYSNFL